MLYNSKKIYSVIAEKKPYFSVRFWPSFDLYTDKQDDELKF